MKNMFAKAYMSSTACANADASSSCALSLIADAIVMASVSVIRVIVRVIISLARIIILRAGAPARSCA